MNNAFNRVQTASHKLAEVLYSQAAPEGATGEQASSATAGSDGGETSSTETGGGSDEDVIDAEYVDVDENNSDEESK